MRDGTLEAIFRKWQVWNDDQPPMYARVLGAVAWHGHLGPAAAPSGVAWRVGHWAS